MVALFAFLWVLSTLICFISLIMVIIKAIKKKSKRTPLKLMIISMITGFIFIIAAVAMDDGFSNQSGNNTIARTADIESAQYSGNDLDELFTNYMETKKDSYKNKLAQADSKELYEVILKNLAKEYYSNGIKTSTVNQYFKDSYDVFKTINGDVEESTKLEKIVNHAKEIYETEQKLAELKNKYGSDTEEYLSNFFYDYFDIEVYVIKKLETAYNDTITSKILKEFESYSQSNPVRYLATSDYTYNPILGHMAGEDYCVIQPLDPFSRDGLYSLNVKQDGYTTLVDSNGFETEAPIYLELSETYINSVYADIDSYADLNDKILNADTSLKALLPNAQ